MMEAVQTCARIRTGWAPGVSPLANAVRPLLTPHCFRGLGASGKLETRPATLTHTVFRRRARGVPVPLLPARDLPEGGPAGPLPAEMSRVRPPLPADRARRR